MRHGAFRIAAGLAVATVSTLFWFGLHGDPADNQPSPITAIPQPDGKADATTGDVLARGRYLVTAGDCRACHSRAGGEPWAGGRRIPTPFGNFYSPNITPDPDTGIGLWTAEDFWQALHNGRGKDGELLYPAFPYPNYTKVQRSDSDAMYRYLQSLPAVRAPNREHQLNFPYALRPLLIAWRALFFRPGEFVPDPGKPEPWNRGAYLVQGLGHCSACHAARNALGAIRSADDPSGGLVLSWYAPSLYSTHEAGLQRWESSHAVALLKTGVAPEGSVLGPMAEVVYESTQHLADADLEAMVSYLQSLPDKPAPTSADAPRVPGRELATRRARGLKLYTEQCAQCHGDDGEGHGVAAPALAGNRALTMASAVNPIRILLFGGYPPGTAGNPRPYGMPPYGTTLSHEQIADVLTYTRSAWGNAAVAVSPVEVRNNSGSPLW